MTAPSTGLHADVLQEGYGKTLSGPSEGVGKKSGDRAAVLAALKDGNRTFRIAKALSWSTPKARYYLIQLERAGLVKRSERYSYPTDIYWVPA